MAYKKYIFKKDYVTSEGTIPKGSEVNILRDAVYLNGGLIHPAYQRLIRDIVETPSLCLEYLREAPIIHNKI